MLLKKIALITSIVLMTSTLQGFETTYAFSIFNKNKNADENKVNIITDSNSVEGVTKYGEKSYNNGVGLTPQMGWSSWNFFKEKINETAILEMADALEKSGLVEAGYTYLNLDDCWQSSMRDENRRLQGDLTNFPSGIKDLTSKVNEKGMKLGLYTSNGTYTCEDLPASLNNEKIDAETFADWGIEYFKYDYCHNIQISNKAPEIDRIYIGKAGEGDSIIIEAEDAKLSGTAKVMNASDSYGGKYVTGLNSNGGYVEFENINVEKDGEYILTIGLKKSGNFDKYAEVIINGKDAYEAKVPPTSAWNPTGRHQLKVSLKAGNNTIKINNPIVSEKDSAIRLYEKMGNELKNATKAQSEETGEAEKPIFYSICEWGNNSPWQWGNGVGNSWRTTPDISANWNTIMNIYNKNVQLYEYAGPGAFNDPDMLEVGNGNLTYEENKAHFSLWCMMAAPLILGNDIREFINEDGSIDAENETLKIITNKDMIDIDQDEKGIQGRIYKTNGSVDILVKSLENDELAVCFFNKGNTTTTTSVNLNEIANQDYIDIPESESYKAYELWDKTTDRVADDLSATIPGHGVKIYRVSPGVIGEVEKEQSVKVNINSALEIGKEIEVIAEVKNTGKETMKDINVSIEAPSGFEVVEVETKKESLAMGESFESKFKLKVINKKGDYTINTKTEFKYDSDNITQSKNIATSVKTMAVPADKSKLGDIDWLSAVSGWGGEVKRNKNIKNGSIVINDKTYTSGMGTHANGETQVFLGGNPYNLKSIIGIDDGTNGGDPAWGKPSAIFEVWADNEKIYDSGLMGYKDSKEIDLDIVGCEVLSLRVTDSGNGNSYDECNWANSEFNKIEVTNTDRVSLKELIDSSTTLANEAVEGIKTGNYHKGANEQLLSEIDKATKVYNDSTTSIEEVQVANANLVTAVEVFKSLIITELTGDINEDGKVSLGDLGITAKYYGDIEEDVDYSKVSDLNKDGKVDKYEINFITKKILD